MLDPLKFDGKKSRDLAPPPRAKFLHFRPAREPTLQERMDEAVYPMAEAVKPALNPNLAQGELEKAQSRGDFGWGSDRIAHELATKLEQFTRRPEDAVRKLLWTVGTEHRFEGKSRNSIAVTPKNLAGLCNRFGLACKDGQARRRCAHHTRARACARARSTRARLTDLRRTHAIAICCHLLWHPSHPARASPWRYALPLYPTPHAAAAGGADLRAPPAAARRVQRADAVHQLAQPAGRHRAARACGGAARARQPVRQQHAIQLRPGTAHAQSQQGEARTRR